MPSVCMVFCSSWNVLYSNMEALCDSSLIEVRWLCRARVVALIVDVNFSSMFLPLYSGSLSGKKK